MLKFRTNIKESERKPDEIIDLHLEQVGHDVDIMATNDATHCSVVIGRFMGGSGRLFLYHGLDRSPISVTEPFRGLDLDASGKIVIAF